MNVSTRYKVKAPNPQVFEAALRLLEKQAQVLLASPRRNTIAATGLDEETAGKLRDMNAVLVEDAKYDLD